PIDLSHPSRAERREDFIGTQARAGGKRHRDARILLRARACHELLEPRVATQGVEEMPATFSTSPKQKKTTAPSVISSRTSG
ncbi:MAG: hypothetical protein ACRD3M_13400, partial [Thermoanaerobaculia bacterium]